MRIVKPKSKRFWIIVAVVIVAALVAAGILYHNHRSNEAAKKTASKKGYSTTKTHKSKSSSSASAAPGGSLAQGGATDNNGQASTSTPTSQWTTSSSGLVSVHQPAANATVTSGTVLSGTAQVDKVYFRVISDSVGVVAQGSLSVVNDNFSGTLNFQTQAGGGRLDVYSYDANGVEINEVQIPIELK